MIDVRVKNTGTFDPKTNLWRIKGKRIHKSVRQLSIMYGIEIPPTKRDSLPYWRRYLQELEESNISARRAASPLQSRIRSIERIIEHLTAQGRPVDDMGLLLDDAINTPVWSDEPDIHVLHPDAKWQAELNGVANDELAIRTLNSKVFESSTKITHGRLSKEIESHMSRLKTGPHGPKQSCDLFFSITGDIDVKKINVSHYREYIERVKENDNWNERTKYNREVELRSLLSGIEADHNLTFGFLRRKLHYKKPEGQKIQYSFEQVKTALKHATGNVRTSLLLGLNCGFYWSDITALSPDIIQDDYIIAGRVKNQNKSKLVGTWKLWSETKNCLEYLVPMPHQQKLIKEFKAFKDEHGLPSHKALRKTVAQEIQDLVGEEESRLYRCEKASGTHGSHYIVNYTPEQVKKLDKALVIVAKKYGIK